MRAVAIARPELSCAKPLRRLGGAAKNGEERREREREGREVRMGGKGRRRADRWGSFGLEFKLRDRIKV